MANNVSCIPYAGIYEACSVNRCFNASARSIDHGKPAQSTEACPSPMIFGKTIGEFACLPMTKCNYTMRRGVFVKCISMGESNTILSAYAKYRHLG